MALPRPWLTHPEHRVRCFLKAYAYIAALLDWRYGTRPATKLPKLTTTD